MPEHPWIAKVGVVDVQYRVARVLRPRSAVIVAVSQVLHLLAASVSRVDGNHRGPLVCSETGRVAVIHHAATTKRHNSVFFRNGQRQVFPMRQVGADSVSPAHVAPGISRRIVLIEQVVFAAMKNKTIRVVHPVDFRSEVGLWSKRLIQIICRLAIFCQLEIQIETFGWHVCLDDMIDVNVPPATGRSVKDPQSRLLAGKVTDIP